MVEKCTFCEERLAQRPPAGLRRGLHRRRRSSSATSTTPSSKVRQLLAERLAIRRKPGLGTEPEVYYIVEDPRTLIEVAPAAVV